ncbi:hypothetical protein HPP92_016306 [Vanilla planifolia]|uniref:EamA domain-containing protein n=1 Tax=Vanilla planifolia TaxID=51239 RepID=A0A835QEZ7_VANPL|nr:hypothetical protein HPP92_016306 [Vanilla planifolia]
MAEANHVVEGTESIAPQRRMVKDIFLRDLFRRRPLWKRIVFASKKVRSIMLLNVITVIYASDIPVLKEVEQIVDPAVFTVVRFSITALPFLPFMLKPDVNSNVRSTGIELGLWISLGYLCQALGLLTSEAGRASFISAFTVTFNPYSLLSFLSTIDYSKVGDVLNFLSALFFGIHILRTEQIVRSTKKTKLSALLGYEVVVVALSSAICFMGMDYFIPWIPALYTGVFSTGLCLVAEMDAMRDVSATETAIIYGLEPVWGAAFAWFLLGERWDFSEWIGAALVLCGSLLVQVLGGTQTTKNDAHFF